jgi:SAM-dependent methyltransferase
MTVFGNYARYYNLLYKDKDYAGETQYIDRLLQKYAPNTKSILDLGCGTGIHASLLVKQGYSVCGVDLSENMLAEANRHRQNLPIEEANKLEFIKSDLRNFSYSKKFDAVTSLFHVISYQINNEDLNAAVATAKIHLEPGGIFIFDCWYGPAVLTDRPTVRVKRLEDENIVVTRIAEPKIYPNDNVVDVNYQVFIKDKITNGVEELNETHKMRYLFVPEIKFILENNNFELVTSGEWMTELIAGFNTWGVYFVARSK